MNSGEYLYWAGGQFEKGTLPTSLNKPSEESGTNQFLVWKDNAFQNVTMSLTAVSADDLKILTKNSITRI